MSADSEASNRASRDPLGSLRAYHALAPWSLADLCRIAGTILEAGSVIPVSASARATPTDRAIRFYVSRGLVDPPEGRGPSAHYRYRQLIQVLAIKLRQMEGASLETLSQELGETTGDVLERRVATALGPGLPHPDDLGNLGTETRGRTARAGRDRPDDTGQDRSPLLRRIRVAPGAELLLEAGHPLFTTAASDGRLAAALAEVLHNLEKGSRRT
jgi:DNA-binding transcriptional MerR regulator